MQNEMSPAEQKLRSIMQNAPVGLLEIEDDGNVISVNFKADILLKPFTDSIAPGTNVFDILQVINPEIPAHIKSFQATNGLIMLNRLFHFTYPDGSEKDFQFTITKMFSNCIIVSFEDLTSRVLEEKAYRQAEQDKAVAQGKYDIASEVLHDIGNAVVGFGSYLTRINRAAEPASQANLTNVVAFLKQHQQSLTQALGDDKAGALISLLDGIGTTVQEQQAEIKRSVTEQLRIVGHIQDILNIQRQYVTGHGSQERKAVNLKEIIHDCQAMIFASMEKKNIRLTLNLPADHVEIRGDRTKLMQVILNLLKNSIEAIDIYAGKKDIILTLNKLNGTVLLNIDDTGKGIDEDTKSKLFNRGYTTKGTGSGLGLYNCRSIIESHNGTIDIQSPGPGKGTHVTIEFNI